MSDSKPVIIDKDYPGLKPHEYLENYFVFEGNMEIGICGVEIKVNLIVKGYQRVEGYQIVKGDQRVEGDQIVKGYQRVEGDQIVKGERNILGVMTKFSMSIHQERYRIYFMSSLLKIGCKMFTPSEWDSFSDEEISRMDRGALEWWKKWKRFVLNTHAELVAVYHAEKIGE